MLCRFSSCLAVAAMLAMVGAAQGQQVLFTNLSPNPPGPRYNNANDYNINRYPAIPAGTAVAVKFTTTIDATLSDILVAVAYFGTGTNHFSAFLRTDTGNGRPSNVNLEAFLNQGPMTLTPTGNNVFTLTSVTPHPLLLANTTYWLILSAWDGTAAGDAIATGGWYSNNLTPPQMPNGTNIAQQFFGNPSPTNPDATSGPDAWQFVSATDTRPIPAFQIDGVAVSPADSFQVQYTSNFNQGAQNVRVINTGAAGGVDGGGNICVNMYVFNASQQMLSCCSCLVTPNGLATLPVNGIFSNPMVIKLVSTYPNNAATGPPTGPYSCNATFPADAGAIHQTRAAGLAAWTDSTPVQSPTHFQVRFEQSKLGADEAQKLATQCTSFGISTCSGCPGT